MPGARTTGVINGTSLLVYIDATHPIGYSTNASLALNADMRDISNKDSAGWKAVLPGQKNWTINCEALVIFTESYNLAYIMNLIIAKITVSIKIATSNIAGDYYFSGSAYVTSCNMNAGNEANATFTVNFQGTGALTLTDPLT